MDEVSRIDERRSPGFVSRCGAEPLAARQRVEPSAARGLLCAALLVAAADDIATKKRLVIKRATKRKPPCSARVEDMYSSVPAQPRT